MDFSYDGNDYSLPDDLSEITLDQHITFMATYGQDLKERERALHLIENEAERNLTSSLLYMERMVKIFSFYSTIPLGEAQNNIDILQVLSYVGATQLALAVQERDMVVEAGTVYVYDGHNWVINPPDALPDGFTYDYYMATNELAGKMLQLSAGDWAAMPSICAAYLRMEGETFNPSGWQTGTAREVLMHNLPLDIALAVGHYLQATLQLFVSVMEDYTAEIP